MNTILWASIVAAACCLASCQIGMADVGAWYERSVEWLVDSSDAIALAEAVGGPVANARDYRIKQLLKEHRELQAGQSVRGPIGRHGQKMLLFFREKPEGMGVFHLIVLDGKCMIEPPGPSGGPLVNYLAVDRRGRVISTEDELIRRVRDRLQRGSSVLPISAREAAEKNKSLWWDAGSLIDEFGTTNDLLVFVPPDAEFGAEFVGLFRVYIKGDGLGRTGEELTKPGGAELVRQQYRRDPFAHRRQIQAYLDVDEIAKARDACRDSLKALPDDAWIVLVNALLTAVEESPEKGASQMQAWVERDADFFRWLDLAYYWQLLDRPRKAAEAMERATKFDAHALRGYGIDRAVLWGNGSKQETQGYSAARYAYESGQYEAAIKLCDTILKAPCRSIVQTLALQSLKSAASDAQQGQRSQLEWPDDPLPYNAFKSFDIEKLLGRAVRKFAKEPQSAESR